ncbi:MAG TPA: hypothetical protein VK550_07500 [Polyangiaceae bacterium]|nr:hypothetical protein [Polyangiaceae bacterium]
MSASDRPKPPSAGTLAAVLDPDAPPSDEERRAAEALRRVLEEQTAHGGDGGEPRAEDDTPMIDADARAAGELANALRAAVLPREISAARHREMLDRALAPHGEGSRGALFERPREAARRAGVPRAETSTVAYLALGSAACLVAMAAAVVLVIRGAAPDASMAAKTSVEQAGTALALSRSTVDLFPEGIPRSGGTTGRVERIAYARARDFRQNQFARWGAP